jgi:hypothetical protein
MSWYCGKEIRWWVGRADLMAVFGGKSVQIGENIGILANMYFADGMGCGIVVFSKTRGSLW